MPTIKKIFSSGGFFLFLISAVVFLPYAIQLTYYLDDWYYVYDGVVAGPNIFHSMFSVDRPIRGYFFDVFFSIFGPYPLPYHVGAYFWRLLAGICALWLLDILWPGNKKINLLISLLFILYPGYSWWVSAIEYQPMAVSLFLQMLSILLTLFSIRTERLVLKAVYAGVSVLAGWAYIALVDYAVGAEILRFLCVYLLVSRTVPGPFLKKVTAALKSSILYLAVTLGFVLWRVFLFESERQATDVDLHAVRFKSAPLEYILKMGTDYYYSILNVGWNAWFKQLYLRLMDFSFNVPVSGWVLTALVVALLGWLGFLWNRQGLFARQERGQLGTTPFELVLLGLVSLSLGVLPVVAFGRFINLSFYSHYGLPVSFAAVVLLAGLILYLPSRFLQYIVLSGFIAAAALTNSLIAERTLVLKNSFENFWWQAAWRIPGVRPDTTLVTLYPYEKVVDNDLGLPEAANLIYFPDPRNEDPIRYLISTIMPTDEHIESIVMGRHKKTQGYRTHEMVVQYKNVVVVTQPSPFACVRVIDGNNYIFSELDTEAIRPIFAYSNIDNIRMIEDGASPPEYAFGGEPSHGWCYYFEKADLAVQGAEWGRAAQLGDEALQLGLTPHDTAEWLPFLQAYAMTGNLRKTEFVLKKIKTDELLNDQLCEMMLRADTKFLPNLEIKNLIQDYSCR